MATASASEPVSHLGYLRPSRDELKTLGFSQHVYYRDAGLLMAIAHCLEGLCVECCTISKGAAAEKNSLGLNNLST